MELLPGLQDDGSKRGRPPGPLGMNFYRLNEKCNKSMWWTVCKYCYAAHVSAKTTIPFPTHIRGRKESWEKHLDECLYYARVTRKPAQSDENQAETDEHARVYKHQRTSPPAFTPIEIMLFWRLLLEFQAEALLPNSFVQLRAVPHRHIIGGRVLDECAEQHSIEQRENVRAVQSGGRVNFLSDVWETIAKQHVLGCMVTLFGCVMNYGLRPTGDRHDGLAIAEQMEEVIEDLLASGWNVGAVVTDNAGQCGRARRILALRYPKFAYIHCFAHDINNLVKAVLKTVFQQISADAAGVASFLNTSTSKWLVRAMKAMHKRYGASLAIFTLCETRWNSMQACFASLLRARGALEDMVFSYRNSNEMPEKLRVLGENEFWTKLETAEKIVLWCSDFSVVADYHPSTKT
ncbi:uncharacterized protein PITG_04340 [Phytophthora infestans T30-4]|uniref:Uncharacterized protein n=1 Tax=Phytophthora infestans (strain T30-4) TaxID=403677 RepID=D0N119_PHYIT|nr:uncharacterized protein PITG_04340 [Phytophthora infestans T30-4]EEY67332.1 conserved hypothetical protein [Phytophthora infestans T30-4]|eukprot:XP_002905980.1 conserved hypothetical protein [Phytophthora infestans T30-4]